jgi:hypothetical protein
MKHFVTYLLPQGNRPKVIPLWINGSIRLIPWDMRRQAAQPTRLLFSAVLQFFARLERYLSIGVSLGSGCRARHSGCTPQMAVLQLATRNFSHLGYANA